MGTSDGTVIGLTKILDNGPNNQRFNIVLVAEGFQNTTVAQDDFNTRCQDVVDAFLAEPWFGAGLLGAINIFRLNVSSTDSGADNPATCGDGSTATAVTAATYFDASYCTSGVRRCLGVDWGLVRSTITAQLATWHAAAVIVNNSMRGGCASGNVFATALSTDFLDVVMHELGHAAFDLADEYSTWAGCSSGETDRDNAPAGEPGEANITAVGTLGGLKWAHLVAATTPVPTMQNPDCSQCDTRANPRPDNTEIGLFEGAGYYHCGYYRPAFTCRMRSSSENYCRVCAEAIRAKLDTFFGTTPAIAASAAELDFGNVGAGTTTTMTVDIANVGTVDVTGITLAVSGTGFSAGPLALGTLAAGALRTVTVTFGPVMTSGPRTGILAVTSSAAAISVDLLAAVCSPSPLLQVVTSGGGLTLDFGDVARQLTMYRWLEVRNRRTACSAQLAVTLSAPTGGFAYAPGTTTSFTLPAPTPVQAFTSRRIYVAFTSPASGATAFNGALTASTADPSATSSITLTLLANSVDPPPVDTVLVLDRSGSMSEPTGVPGASKMDLAIQAANLYVSLLKDNDRIGAVRFNNTAQNPGDVLQPLAVAGDPVSGAGRAAVRAALTPASLTPAGSTSIGGGTILGSAVLDAAVATARAVIVLTDGIQNAAPDIPTATTQVSAKSPRQRVFAVGLGLNQLEDRLVQLASVTNGVAQITGELVGSREFLLQKLYVQILSDVGDEAFVQDPVEVIYPGMERATEVWIGEVDVAADFIVAYRRSASYPNLETWLEAPDGTIIRPADAGTTFPNVRLVFGEGHYYFRVQFPPFPGRADSHIGRWRIWIASRAKNSRAMYYVHGASSAGGASVPFVYSAMAKARSDLLVRGFVAQSAHAPGTPIAVVLEPVLYGEPVALDEPVIVAAARPDGAVRYIPLERDLSGQYRGVLTDTWLIGPYRFTADVSATTPLGNRVTRYRTLTGLIFLPGRDGGGDGGGDDGGDDGGNGGDDHDDGGHDDGGGRHDSEDGGVTVDDCRKAGVVLGRLDRLIASLAEHGHELDPSIVREVASITRRLRSFVADCCGCAPVVLSDARQAALVRARELIRILEADEPTP